MAHVERADLFKNLTETIYYAYVVGEHRRLLGFVLAKQFRLALLLALLLAVIAFADRRRCALGRIHCPGFR